MRLGGCMKREEVVWCREGGRQEMDGGTERRRKVVRKRQLMTEWSDCTAVRAHRRYSRFLAEVELTR